MSRVRSVVSRTRLTKGGVYLVASSVVMSVVSIWGMLSVSDVEVFDFTWRWISAAYIAALLIMIWLVIKVTRVMTTERGIIYWFMTFCSTVIFIILQELACSLSANAATQAFWGGLATLGWMPLTVSVLFFTISYIDDVDLSKPVSLWLAPLIAAALVLYVGGATNLFMSHVPNHPELHYWGYRSQTGPLDDLVTAYGSIILIMSSFKLFRMHRRATSEIVKKQSKIFAIGFTMFIAVALLLDFILPSINDNLVPPAVPIYATMFAILLAKGITKYGIFKVTPTSLAEPILRNLAEGVVGLDESLRIQFVNAGAATMYGNAESSVKGKHVNSLLTDETYQKLAAQLEAADDLVVIEDAFAVGPKGQETPVIITASKVYNDRDKLGGYVLVIQNVTELKQQNALLEKEKASVERKVRQRTQELHEERARLRSSIEGLSLGFVLVDERGKIVMQNREIKKLLGLENLPETAEKLQALFANFDLVAFLRESHKKGALPASQEVNYGTKILRIFAAAVTEDSESSAFQGDTVVLIEDITEAKVAERSRDEFFSIASHELRTPLTVIRGNTSLVLNYYQKELDKDEGLKDIIEDIHNSSIRLIDIVSDFLDMSRLEQGKFVFKLQECSIEDILEKVIYEMRLMVSERDLHIEFANKQLATLPKVWADPDRLKQIAYNLISNAVKYTRHTITINAKQHGQMIVVSVGGDGRGISNELKPLLFHKFQQAGNSLLTRDTSRGTGLGLYISRLMAQNMGGSVELESSEKDKGATFVFTIPEATEAAKKAAQGRHVNMTDPATGLAEE